jgi:DNA-binding MarR family transcriptional regulator
VAGQYRPLLGELGLTFPQYLVMMCLWESGELRVGELGARLGMDTGTLSPLLQRLQAVGVVSRRRRAEDGRSVAVGLTPAGRALQQRAVEISARMIDLIGLDAAEFERLRTQLRQLADRLCAIDEDKSAESDVALGAAGG